MFTLKVDLDTGIVEAEMFGIWDVAQVALFGRDLARAGRQVEATGQRFLLLGDYSRAHVQSQEVVVALQHLSITSEPRSARCALFTDSVLARLQARRLATARDTIAVFYDRAEALAWLLEYRDLPEGVSEFKASAA